MAVSSLLLESCVLGSDSFWYRRASSRKGWQEARMPQLNFWSKQNLKEARRVLFLC